MADKTFLQSNNELKLRDLEDGTFAQSVVVEKTVTIEGTVAISGDGITIENVDISGLNTISTIEQVLNVPSVDTVDTVSAVEEVINVTSVDTVDTLTKVVEVVSVGTLLDGTVTIQNASIVATVESINTVSVVEEVTKVTSVENVNTVSVVEEVVKIGTLLDGTVTIQNANVEVIGTVSIESNVLTSVSHTSKSLTTDSSTTVLNDNPNRNYTSIFNPNATPIFVGLGKVAEGQGGGIYIPEDSAYEMSAGFGNLYRGQISVVKPSGDGIVFVTEGE